MGVRHSRPGTIADIFRHSLPERGLSPAWAPASAALFLPCLLAAQSPEAANPVAVPVVRAIEIRRSDIFDPSEAGGWLQRAANGLHYMTREAIVRRELLFRAGEPYDSARVFESARNLRALGVFRDVSVDTVTSDSGLVVRVVTRDGWSTRPDFGFSSTGDEVSYSLEFLEDNFIGSSSRLRFFHSRDPDRSSSRLAFWLPRVVGDRIGLNLEYALQSDGHRVDLALIQPFLSLSSRFGLLIEAQDLKARVLQFRDGARVAQDTVERRSSALTVEAGWAPRAGPGGYVRLGLVAEMRRDLPVEAFPDRTGPDRGGAGGFVELRRARFVVTRGYRGFARAEDVDLSTTLRLETLMVPRLFGGLRDAVEPAVSAATGRRVPGGFIHGVATASGRISAAGLETGTALLRGTLVLQPGARHLMVLHAEGGMQERPLLGREFDLGQGWGVRAFRTHSFTGDRAASATLEYRWTVAPSLGNLVGVGLAAFVDRGGAWFAGSAPRYGTDAGVGLRLLSSRGVDRDALRIDLARRSATDLEPGGWVLAAGKGFVFFRAP